MDVAVLHGAVGGIADPNADGRRVHPAAVGDRAVANRDPRDLATSLYLSHFQPGQQIWTTSPDSIRRTIELSQRVMPRLLEVLGIPHVSVLYEDLVEDPARDARRALALLGLEMDDAVLSPEQNTRAAMTQSVAQVRRPINRTSVGRWKNYAFAFDASWEAVVAEHERRRAHARGAT